MSFEIIDNTFQVIVLAAMALLAFLLAFRRSSRSCLILAFGYASFMMGTLYYLLHLIILGHGPQVFYVAECSWMASYFFFLSLEILYWEGLRWPISVFRPCKRKNGSGLMRSHFCLKCPCRSFCSLPPSSSVITPGSAFTMLWTSC